MAGSSVIMHHGKEIFCLSVADLQLSQKAEVQRLLQDAKTEISKRPPKSLLVITDVSNTGYDSEVATMFKEYASHNTPYVKASAVVGATGIQRIILAAIKTLTKREFYLASTIEEAQDWLVQQ